MVSSFKLLRSPKIIFGIDQLQLLPSLLPGNTKHLIVITGLKSYTQHATVDHVFQILEKAGLKLFFEQISQEPSPADIDGIVERYRNRNIDALLSVGGGSVLDAGKAVSAMLPVDGSVRDFLEGVGTGKHPGIKKFFIAVPTTSGTGSEATANAVISESGVNGFKRSLRHENLMPDIALVDPMLTIDLPADITACSGMDAFTQLVESFLSLKGNLLIDALALEGIGRVKSSLVNAVKNGKDLDARTSMSYAALLSGITLANGGLGLVHGFASSVGGLFDIPHGMVCATLMGVVNRFNIEKIITEPKDDATRVKYARIGRLLSDRDDLDMDGNIRYVADYLDTLTDHLPLKRLGDYGVTEQHLMTIATNTDHKANPVKFENAELIEILKKRL